MFDPVPKAPLAVVAAPKGLIGGPFGSSLGKKDYVPSGIPVIRGHNLSGPGRFNDSEFVYVTKEKALGELARNLAQPGDVVFTQRGTLGQVGLIPIPKGSDGFYVISQSQMRLRVDPTKADAAYVYYCFRDPQMLALIESRAVVTGVPHINLAILGEFPIPLPPLSEQRAIAEVLGALDDKIEANRRVVALVESLARMLVTQAQAEADLMLPIGALVDRVAAVVQPADIPVGATYIALEHMPRGSLILSEFGTPEAVASTKATFGVKDVLFGKLRPYFKKVAVAPASGVCSTDILVLRAKSGDWAVASVVCASDEVIDYATAGSEGTRMPRVSWNYLSRLELPMPDHDDRMALQSEVAPLLELGMALSSEARRLAYLRDTLLPKLLSGELRVGDAESLVGEAV